MATRNSENTQSALEIVKKSQQRFAQTNQSLKQMIAAMGDIAAQSDRISKIIKVIDEIAFQTNILALNAAVGAARAGEAGPGFAVVVDEVRGLAQRCAQAAKDTSTLIEESIAKSNHGKSKWIKWSGRFGELEKTLPRSLISWTKSIWVAGNKSAVSSKSARPSQYGTGHARVGRQCRAKRFSRARSLTPNRNR